VLTFWRMKRRARDVGAGGVAALLASLQDAAPDARFHLMGHSFGCIVVSSAVAGPGPGGRRPIASLALVQGAMSLWSFCSAIPSSPGRAGFFHRVLADGLVAGPVVVTTSVHDRALGSIYSIGAGAGGQVDYLPDRLPTYGAIGAFGVRGPGIRVVDDDLRPVEDFYALQSGVVHNLRADEVIRDSAPG
jgi:pimeloyl-ACP methyl ester carboxylesterase